MKNLRDWTPGQVIQAVVYGRSGAGKTWGALTFPRPNVIDFDLGVATGRNPDFVKAYGLRDILYEQFVEKRTMKGGVPLAHNAFDDACKYFDKCMASPVVETFDTWIIDTGTTLSQAAMNKAIILLGGMKMSQTHANAQSSGLVFPKLQDYGSERSLVEQFVRMVKDSGKHVLFLCHEKEITDDEGNVTSRVPLLTGKSPEVVGAMFDEVYNLRVVGAGPSQKRVLTTRTNGITMAKSRYGMPDGMEFNYPAMQAEFAKITAGPTPPVVSGPPENQRPVAR